MAIRIVKRTHTGRDCGERCEILTDAESDIKALGATVNDGYIQITPAPGSIAYTADMKTAYQLSPSGEWVKMGGGE